MQARWLIPAALALAAYPAQATRIHRSHEVLTEFQKGHPCPSTGRTKGACPGYIKDHVIPLCAGGADAVENLQWQTKKDAAAKDKLEWAECREVRR